MKRHCLALDLKDDPKLIAEYDDYHTRVWPEILQSLRDSGIESMEIYRVGKHLFMIIDVKDSFSFEEKLMADKMNPKVQEWETLMWKYQDALPYARPGEKWTMMQRVFEL